MMGFVRPRATAPIARVPLGADYPTLAPPGSLMRNAYHAGGVFARSLRNWPDNIRLPNHQPNTDATFSMTGVVSVTTHPANEIVSLGPYVQGPCEGDVNMVFHDHQTTKELGRLQVRTRWQQPQEVKEFCQDLCLTAGGPFIPPSIAQKVSTSVQQWRQRDPTMQYSPFTLTPHVNFLEPYLGSITLHMKIWSEKLWPVRDEFRRPELRVVWEHGYDLVMHVDNMLLSTTGANGRYYFEWKNRLPNTEPTSWVILGWIDHQSELHLLPEPIVGGGVRN